jgi:hypothetical protein
MIDLTPFCATVNFSSRLDTPFVKTGWMYATDGVVCVRMPCKEHDTPDTGDMKFPNAGWLFRCFRSEKCRFKLPKAADECSGELCPTCRGQPWLEPQGRCISCMDTGLWYPSQVIAGVLCNPQYIALIHTLGRVRYSRMLIYNALAFVAPSGVQGLLNRRIV